MNIGKLIENRPSSDIITVGIDQPVRDAVAILASKRIGALPVMRGDTVAGIFSERDVIYRLADEGQACLDLRVGDIMTAPAITIDRDTDILDALGLMSKRRIRHLPVLDGQSMCGFISIGDLVQGRLDEIQQEASAMRAYIQTA